MNANAEQSSTFLTLRFLIPTSKYKKGREYRLKKVVADKYLAVRYAVIA